MRVLITNSLVLAAISLAPSASAAPYTATSSVDSYGSYSNSTALAQGPGPSSVPSTLYPCGCTLGLSRPVSPLDVQNGEVVHLQSMYGDDAFGNTFGRVADLFRTIGMNTISEGIPITEVQKVLDQLRDELDDAADRVVPADRPTSPLPSRSLEDRQSVNPLATLHNLPGLGAALDTVLNLLKNPTTPLTDLQKQVIAEFQSTIDVAANVPVKPEVLPLGHQSRSVEESSQENTLSSFEGVSDLDSDLSSVTRLIDSLGVTNGNPLDDFQKQKLSELQAAIAKVTQNVKARVPPVHTEHAREDHEDWDHHDHDPHRDAHRPHDQHKDDDKPWEAHKDDNRSRDVHEDDNKPHDAHKDDQQPHDVHKGGRKSPDVHKEDHSVHSANREGYRCREPREGQRNERHKWDDCTHRKNGQDRDGDSSLLKINL